MARPYSVDQLLDMRETLPVVICDLTKMNSSVSPGLIGLPNHTHSDIKRSKMTSQDSNNPSVDCSVTQSDCIRSNNARSRSGTIQKGSSLTGDDDRSNDGEDIVSKGHRTYQSSHSGWKLQNRRFADRLSEPFPAPPGDGMHKAENFKKFYEAVISPTHIRVTAGGRIVPNIRGAPNCGAYSDSEAYLFEVPHSPSEPPGSWPKGEPVLLRESHAPLSIASAAGLNFCGPPLASQTLGASPGQAVKQTTKEANSRQSSNIDTHVINEGHIGATNGDVKISPPGQFDSSKPFVYNGQLVYPLPAGFQVPSHVPIHPFSMLGNPNVQLQPFIPQQGIALPTPLQFAQPMIQSNQFLGQHAAVMTNPGFNPVGIPTPMHAVGQVTSGYPTFSQTAPIDQHGSLLRHHFQDLQQQLKYLENQIQNNKHQINEPYMKAQQTYVQNQINALQGTFGLPASQIYEPPLMESAQNTIVTNSGLQFMGLSAAEASNPWEFQGTTQVLQNEPVTAITDPLASHVVSSIKRMDPSPAKPATSIAGSPDLSPSEPPEPSSRKRLRAAAATAPPFQPRSQQALAAQASAFESKLNDATQIEDHGKPIDLSQPLANAGSSPLSRQGNMMVSPSLSIVTQTQTPVPAALPTAHTIYSPVLGKNYYGSPMKLQQFNSLPVPSSAPFEHSANSVLKPVAPYLLGFPPSGVSLERAKSSELVYTRELTEEERHARYLYWGNAPREVFKGLPKFDGRDFYPPSPIKTPATPVVEVVEKKNDSNHIQSASSSLPPPPEVPSPDQTTAASSFHLKSGNVSESFGNSNDSKLNFSKISALKVGPAAKDDISLAKAWDPEETALNETLPGPLHDSLHSMNSQLITKSFKPKDIKYPTLRRPNLKITQPSFLQDMLRNSVGTAMAAATGALSSATARGHLPQYSGSAAASLSPSMNNAAATPVAHNNIEKCNRPGSAVSVQTENRPPSRLLSEDEPLSAADLLRKVTRQAKQIADPSFDPKTGGVGPVYSGSDW